MNMYLPDKSILGKIGLSKNGKILISSNILNSLSEPEKCVIYWFKATPSSLIESDRTPRVAIFGEINNSGEIIVERETWWNREDINLETLLQRQSSLKKFNPSDRFMKVLNNLKLHEEAVVIGSIFNNPIHFKTTIYSRSEDKVILFIPLSEMREQQLKYTRTLKVLCTMNKEISNLELIGEVLTLTKKFDGLYINLKIRRIVYGDRTEFEYLEGEPYSEMKEFLTGSWVTLRYFLGLTRFSFFLFPLVSVLLTMFYLYSSGVSLSPRSIILELLAILFLQLSMNVFNDYFDSKSYADIFNPGQGSMHGGSKFIKFELIEPSKSFQIGVILSVLGLFLSLLLIYFSSRFDLLAFGFFVFLFALAFSTPPLKLSYRGWGEIQIPILLVVAPVVGTIYLFTGSWGFTPFFELYGLIIPLALTLFQFTLVNSMADSEADKKAGKETLAIKLSGKNLTLLLYASFGLSYVFYPLLSYFYNNWALSLLLILAIPHFLVINQITGSDHNSKLVDMISIKILILYLGFGLISVFALIF